MRASRGIKQRRVVSSSGGNGIFGQDDVRNVIRPVSRYIPVRKMLLVEQTANLGGGAI